MLAAVPAAAFLCSFLTRLALLSSFFDHSHLIVYLTCRKRRYN
nr:MAG TPA: hypothetical protein [Caudoviricetes sp.]